MENKRVKSSCKFLHGSSGQGIYNQELAGQSGRDSSIFLICVVPIQIVDALGVVVWRNPSPSSPYLCRPVKFFFAKETADLIRQEQEEMETNIRSLTTTSVRRGDVTSIIMHVFELTMVDGKVANACDNVNSSQRCNICSLTISQFNSPHAVSSVIVNECAYEKGLSTFHCLIRAMEWCLHVSYNLGFCKWTCRGTDDKVSRQVKKQVVQDMF